MSIFKRTTIKPELKAPVSKPEPIKAPLVVEEKPRASKDEGGQKLLWYPAAQIIDCGMKAAGKYRKGYPEGAVIHWHSGWSRNGEKGVSANKYAISCLEYGARSGYGYLALSETGMFFQAQPLDSWDHHAGPSSHPKLGSSVSQYLVGIEVCCAGRLTKVAEGKYKSWFGAEFKESEVRYSKKNGNIAEGYYHKYTEAQEESLIEFLLWMKRNNPDVFNFDLVVGHDEVAPKRKTDPGASLSMPMSEFRELLKKRYMASL